MTGKERGSFYIDALIGLSVILALALSFLTIPELLVKKQLLDYIAEAAARRIERDGMADADFDTLMDNLSEETGIAPDIELVGAFQGARSKIQIRERFVVTANLTVRVKLADPSFSEAVFLDIPIRKTVSGVSEVYWKDLS